MLIDFVYFNRQQHQRKTKTFSRRNQKYEILFKKLKLNVTFSYTKLNHQEKLCENDRNTYDGVIDFVQVFRYCVTGNCLLFKNRKNLVVLKHEFGFLPTTWSRRNVNLRESNYVPY